MKSNLIIDISHYQPSVDFKKLKALGQDYAIVKCANGYIYKDGKWEVHYASATLAGVKVAPYFWVDPSYDPIAQAKYFLDCIKGKNIAWIELDFEQWWGDWTKWNQWRQGQIGGDKVPVVSPDSLFNHFKAVYNYIAANSTYKIVVYTAPWFLNSYCKKAYDFLKDKYTHWADYSGFSGTPVVKTWAQLESLCPVGKRIPSLPLSYPLDKVVMRQWSGDTYKADGVYGDIAGTTFSNLDLNVWLNKTVTIEQFGDIDIIIPPQEKALYDVKIIIGALNVRSTPQILSNNVVTVLLKGATVSIYEEKNGWGRMNRGWISLGAAYVTKVDTSIPSDVKKGIIMATAGLNVRSEASTSSAKIGSLSYNQTIYIESVSNGWGKLYGRTGYVYMYYVKLI